MAWAMKSFLFSIVGLAILTGGCAHRPVPLPSPAPTPAFSQTGQISVASAAEQLSLKSPEAANRSESPSKDHIENGGEKGVGTPESLGYFTQALNPLSDDPIQPVRQEDSSVPILLRSAEISGKSDGEGDPKNLLAGQEGAEKDKGELDDTEKEEETRAKIADPLEPFNRAMYHFNDKLYFWALKPVAQGYSKVVPEAARVSVKNFFTNLAFPARFVSCLLQADLNCAGAEAARFTVNTILGVGGLFDLSKEANLPKQNVDLGQTLGVYGLGNGFYIVWPIVGPSTLRDSVGIVGGYFLYPVSYLTPWYLSFGVRGYQEVNATSLRIGDYESLKEAAIDPYVAIRDAYIQYRQNMIQPKVVKPEQNKN